MKHLVGLDDLLLVTVDHLDWDGAEIWMQARSSTMDHLLEANQVWNQRLVAIGCGTSSSLSKDCTVGNGSTAWQCKAVTW